MTAPRSVLAFLALLALAAWPVHGTTLIKKSLAELSQEAEAIIVARVVSNACAWDDAQRIIWTTTQLQVLDTWKGAVGDQLSVEEPGGEVPPIGQHVPGMARYGALSQVVVFLKKDAQGRWRTHGCMQGAFALRSREEGVLEPVFDAATRHVVAGFFPGAPGSPQVPTLAAFEGKVRELVSAAGRGR